MGAQEQKRNDIKKLAADHPKENSCKRKETFIQERGYMSLLLGEKLL